MRLSVTLYSNLPIQPDHTTPLKVMRGKNLVTVKGVKLIEAIAAGAYAPNNLLVVKDVKSALRAVQKHRVDAAILLSEIADELLNMAFAAKGELYKLQPVLYTANIHFYLHKKNAKLKDKLEKALLR